MPYDCEIDDLCEDHKLLLREKNKTPEVESDEDDDIDAEVGHTRELVGGLSIEWMQVEHPGVAK